MKRNITDWPYNGEDGMTQNYQNDIDIWVECTEEHYWNQMECLPPIRQKQGAFMVGECYSYKGNDNTYACFVEVKFHSENNPRYFGKICALKSFDPVLFKMQIIDQVLGKE